MHGNVWEWCRDGYADKLKGGTDPLQSTSNVNRVYRGGCWHNPGVLCLSSTRAWGESDDRGSGLGFRVTLAEREPPD
jgi:formylglycine-generating enzyme required for sulfatase activity